MGRRLGGVVTCWKKEGGEYPVGSPLAMRQSLSGYEEVTWV